MSAKNRIESLLSAIGGQPLSGARIALICGIGSCRLYLALAALEKEGIIESDWEGGDSFPRRRLYRIKYLNTETVRSAKIR